MASSSIPGPPRRGFRLALLVLVLFGVETLSYTALAIRGRTLAPIAALGSERAEVLAGDAMGAPPDRKSDVYAIHPYLGFVYSPAVNSPDFLVGHENPVSDQGFIDAGPPVHHRSEGKVILGIFGGSVAYFFSVKGLPALEAALGADPAFAGKSFEVMRSALGGWKQPQQLMALGYLLAEGGELDVLVNIDGFNEVALYPAENGPARVNPIYPTSWPQMVRDTPRSRVLVAELAALWRTRRRQAKNFAMFPLRFSPTCNVAWKSLDVKVASDIASRTAALKELSKDGGFVEHGPPFAGTTDDGIAECVAIWKRSSLQMDRLCRENGIRYVHVIQPNQYDPGSKPLDAWEKEHAYQEHHGYRPGVEKGYPLLRKAADELHAEGVEIYDLTGIFSGVSEATYRDACCHLNDRGNRLVAEEIARRMAARGPLR